MKNLIYKILKLTYVYVLSLSMLHFLSCTSGDYMNAEPQYDETSDTYSLEISFEINNDELDTRGYNGNWLVSNERAGGWGEDGLIPHENEGFSDSERPFTFTIYNGEEILASYDDRIRCAENGYTRNGNGVRVTAYPDRIMVYFTMAKGADLSSMSVFSEYNSYKTSAFNGDKTYNNLIFYPCKFMYYGPLTDIYGKVNSKIILKRRTTEFYLLTDEDMSEVPSAWDYYSMAVLNCEPDVLYGINMLNSGDNAYSYDVQTYDFKNDIAYAQSEQKAFPTLITNTHPNYVNNYKITFNGKKYYLIGSDRSYITNKGELPVITDDISDAVHTEPNKGKSLRYLIGQVSTYGNKDVRKVAIDLSGFNLKPNSKYVITNKSGTKFLMIIRNNTQNLSRKWTQ